MWPKSFFCNGWLLVNNVPGLDTSTHPSKKIEALKPEKKLYQTNWKKEKRFLRFYPPSICSRFVENIHYPLVWQLRAAWQNPRFLGVSLISIPAFFFAKGKDVEIKGQFLHRGWNHQAVRHSKQTKVECYCWLFRNPKTTTWDVL